MSQKRQEGGFEKDVRKAIESDPEYASAYFEELLTRPLPVQMALMRKYLGLSQEEVAKRVGLKQTHISRLEKSGSDHLLSLYKKVAEKLGAHLAIVPGNMVLISKRQARKLAAA